MHQPAGLSTQVQFSSVVTACYSLLQGVSVHTLPYGTVLCTARCPILSYTLLPTTSENPSTGSMATAQPALEHSTRLSNGAVDIVPHQPVTRHGRYPVLCTGRTCSGHMDTWIRPPPRFVAGQLRGPSASQTITTITRSRNMKRMIHSGIHMTMYVHIRVRCQGYQGGIVMSR